MTSTESDIERFKQYKREYVKKWYQENKDAKKSYCKEYYEDNKDKIAEQKREYYDNNKDKIAAQQREYYEANKSAIHEKLKEKTTCVCGSCYRRTDKSKHERTIKHQTFINSQS